MSVALAYFGIEELSALAPDGVRQCRSNHYSPTPEIASTSSARRLSARLV